MSEQTPDVIKELVKEMNWSCPDDTTTMLFLNYRVEKHSADLTITLKCPTCDTQVWIRWRYEMDGVVKQERTVNDDQPKADGTQPLGDLQQKGQVLRTYGVYSRTYAPRETNL